jgi:hypothetical protein
MAKIDQIHPGTVCAAPADITERLIRHASVSDVALSNHIDGKTSWTRYVSDPRFGSPTLRAMPLPQMGWCQILLRS